MHMRRGRGLPAALRKPQPATQYDMRQRCRKWRDFYQGIEGACGDRLSKGLFKYSLDAIGDLGDATLESFVFSDQGVSR